MIKRGKTAGILNLVFCISFLWPTMRGEEGRYFLKYFYVLEYGPSAQEIGILVEEETPRLGPYAFSVARNGEIYIADPVNGCVKVFSVKKGMMERAISIEGLYDDLMVDERGNLFLLDRVASRILKVSLRGEKSAIPIPPAMALRPCVLARVGREVAIFVEDKETYFPRSNAKLTGSLTQKGLSIVSKWKDKNTGIVEIFDGFGNKVKTFTLDRPDLASVVFLGEDGEGNIYIQIEFSISETEVGLEVVRLTAAGEKVIAIPIPENDYYVWTSRLLFVDKNGAIYQVLPAKSKVKINVWVPQEVVK